MRSTPKISFCHMGIFVRDLSRMESFYTRVLGLTVTDRGVLNGRNLVFVSSDPNEHHQIVLASGRPGEVPFNVINQMSFRVADLAALREMFFRLKAEAVEEIDPASHGNALSVYFRDPEGNRIELYIDTPWYVDQPLKVPLDLTLPDEAIWRWAEETARRLPGFRPRPQWVEEMRQRMAGE